MVYDNDADTGKTSLFNAGLLQVKRIGDLQERINLVSLNPLLMNEQFQVYNYEIWITSIDSLLQEVSPKLSDKERLEAEKIRDAIYSFLEKHPIFTTTRRISNKNVSTKVNRDNWKVLYKVVTIYEKNVRYLLDVHKLNSPEEEDEGMF